MAEISRATTNIRSRHGRTRVTITLTPVFAANWFMPRMKRLTEAYPELELNLVTTTRVIDIAKENVDFAIRRGREVARGLESQQLLEERVVPVASRACLQSAEQQSIATTLGSSQLLVNTTLETEWKDWCHVQKVELPSDVRWFNLETYELTINAALDGLGIALGRRPMIDTYLADGSLVLPFNDQFADIVHHRLIWSKNRSLGAMAKKVRDWLLQESI